MTTLKYMYKCPSTINRKFAIYSLKTYFNLQQLESHYIAEIFFDTCLAFNASVTLTLTYCGLSMTYMVMMWTLLPLGVKVFTEAVFSGSEKGKK